MSLSVFQRTIVNESGDTLPTAQIDVFIAGTATRPDLFSDAAGTTPITNPFNADVNGFAQFYLFDGQYDVQANLGGSSAAWDDVNIGITSVEVATPRQYGAIGNGIIDDTSSIIAALASGKTLDLGGSSNIFLISTSLVLGVGQSIIGNNATLKTTSDITILNLSDDCLVRGVRFLGNATGVNQRGINIDGGVGFDEVSRTKVIGCNFKDIKGSGYRVTRVVDAHQGNILSGSIFTNCGIGVNLDERGEYTLVTGCTLDGCDIGTNIIAGNSNINACNISNSVTHGVYIGAGGNDAHGLISGCTINHSVGNAIMVDNPNIDAFRISNCDIFFGDIYLNKTSGIIFSNCTFGILGSMFFQGSIDDIFNSCDFITSLPVMEHNYLGENSKTFFTNCTYGNLVTSQSSQSMNGGFSQVSLAVDIDLVSTVLTTSLVFDTVNSNALLTNLNYGIEDFFDIPTSTFNLKNAVNSPNRSFYMDCDIAIAIGVTSGAVDHTKLNVFLENIDASPTIPTYEGILTPLPFENGTNPGLSWKVYTLKGRVRRGNYKITIENNTGVDIRIFRHQGLTAPCIATFAGF